MPDAKRTCSECGAFLEGYTLNNVTGEYGYRGADGNFYKSEEEYRKAMNERERKIREDLKRHMFIRDFKVLELGTDKVLDIVPVYSTRSGMFLIEYPYKYSMVDCLKMTRHIGKEVGMCYGIFNGVPMFSFDTYDTFFRRQHKGMTQEDYAEFIEALDGDHYDGEKAGRILRERTWKHLRKRY